MPENSRSVQIEVRSMNPGKILTSQEDRKECDCGEMGAKHARVQMSVDKCTAVLVMISKIYLRCTYDLIALFQIDLRSSAALV